MFYFVGCFESIVSEVVDDGWVVDESEEFFVLCLCIEVCVEIVCSIIICNILLDVGFSQLVNLYCGCEYGCFYCFVCFLYVYLNLLLGLDFEIKLFVKINVFQLLCKELLKLGYVLQLIVLGINIDVYQLIECKFKLICQLIEVMLEIRYLFLLIIKNVLVECDIDLFVLLVVENLVSVYFLVILLDLYFFVKLELCVLVLYVWLCVMKCLYDVGILVGVMVVLVILWINDSELEVVLEVVYDVGVSIVGYVLLCLLLEVVLLFCDWFDMYYFDCVVYVMSIIQQLCGGKDYDSWFGMCMWGQGVYVDLLNNCFKLVCKWLGFNVQNSYWLKLDCSWFQKLLLLKKDLLQGLLF